MVRPYDQINEEEAGRQDAIGAAEREGLASTVSKGDRGVFVGGVPFSGGRTFRAQPGEAETFGATKEQVWAEGITENEMALPEVQAELADLIAEGKLDKSFADKLPEEMRARAQPRTVSVQADGRTIEGSAQDVIAQLSENQARGGGGGAMTVAQVQAQQAQRAVEQPLPNSGA
jgi:hypothetical protein